MPSRLTNLLLLLLVLAGAATGLLGWALPEPRALPLYDLHRALGAALVLLLLWKQVIVRGSLRRRLVRRRRDRSVVVGLLAGLALLGSLGFGLAWALQMVSFEALWGYSPLNLHVFLALAVVPLMVRHLSGRWERRPAAAALVTRRSALRLIGLLAGTTLSWRLLERTADARAGDARRRSGSKHAGSFSGNAYPVTIWQLDTVPSLDAASWGLTVGGKVADRAVLPYAALEAMPRSEVTIVLDCTSGWWSEQVWAGVAVGDVLDAYRPRDDARWVDVVSVTGHRWTFPLEELRGALLATRVGGEPLSPAHGYPVRLVAPGRRGFQWVKWVDRLEVV